MYIYIYIYIYIYTLARIPLSWVFSWSVTRIRSSRRMRTTRYIWVEYNQEHEDRDGTDTKSISMVTLTCTLTQNARKHDSVDIKTRILTTHEHSLWLADISAQMAPTESGCKALCPKADTKHALIRTGHKKCVSLNIAKSLLSKHERMRTNWRQPMVRLSRGQAAKQSPRSSARQAHGSCWISTDTIVWRQGDTSSCWFSDEVACFFCMKGGNPSFWREVPGVLERTWSRS
jgi:hypothetical protein